MAAEPDELERVGDPQALARPVFDARARAHHPFAVGLVQEDARVEALGPVDHRRVVVRMRDRDRLDPVRCGIIDERHAVPEQRLDLKGALTDRKRRLDSDTGEPRLDLLDARMVRLPQRLERRPLLSSRTDVLALVEADRALGRRLGARRELCTACNTEVRRHP